MQILSTKFIKGVVATDSVLEDGVPQVAFIGRSNVGKSSTINALAKKKDLARTSSFPGRTQEINVFLINKAFYLVDLPGYGYTKSSLATKEKLRQLIQWYFFHSGYEQKMVVFIIDANVGLTLDDRDMLGQLEEHTKNVIIVANKVDKLKPSLYHKQMANIQESVGTHIVIPFSSTKKIGIGLLTDEIVRCTYKSIPSSPKRDFETRY